MAEGVVAPKALEAALMDRRDGMREERLIQILDDADARQPNDPELEFKAGDLVWERIPYKKDTNLNNHCVGCEPLPEGKKRAKAFQPRWTGPWEQEI